MCQVRPIGSSWMIIIWSCWKFQKLSVHENNCLKSPERDKILIPIEVDQYTFYPGRPNFSEFLDLHNYSKHSSYYRLFCFWQILFSMCCLLILMNLWVVSEGMNHREVGIQYILHQYEFRMSSQQYLSGGFIFLY